MSDLDLGDDLVTAMRACAAAEHDRQVGIAGGAGDRHVWGPPPFVVTTFYHPFYNQVRVEGASLAPQETLDDPAVLYGQDASIIGHELGHAFDSRGAQRDAQGHVRSWWSDEDEAEFRRRSAAVEGHVDGYQPRGVDDAGVDGALVGFECVAELICMHLAWVAYCEQTTPAQRDALVDGVPNAQRFWLAKAYGRHATDRPQTAVTCSRATSTRPSRSSPISPATSTASPHLFDPTRRRDVARPQRPHPVLLRRHRRRTGGLPIDAYFNTQP